MASLLLSRRLIKKQITTNLRLLSSINNPFGYKASIQKELRFYLANEESWSTINKQFQTSKQFSLPGQIGLSIDDLKHLEDTNQKHIDLINKSTLKLRWKMNMIDELLENKIRTNVDEEVIMDKLRKHYEHFELKAFKCPISLQKDFQSYLPSANMELTVLTVSLKAKNDMSMYNDDVENEREILMKKFVDMAQDICVSLKSLGFWADFIDPSSGTPHSGPYTHATFYETDERYRNFGFEIIDYGCCKVVSHHKWGTKSYVGSIITSAPKHLSCVQDFIALNDD